MAALSETAILLSGLFPLNPSLPDRWHVENRPGPLGWCILGGEQLHQDASYIVSLLTPEQVQQVTEALRPLTKEWMRTRYFKIGPAGYGTAGMLSDEDFEYAWDWFEGVRDYYIKAAAEGRWSIFTVDQ